MKKNRNQQQRRRKRNARTAPAQHPSNGFSQQARVPVRFPLFPRQLQFSSNYTQTVEVALSNVTQYNRVIGLFEFLNQLPQYANDAFELYRFSRICAVEIKLIAVGEMTSASTNYAFEAGMGRLPYDEAISSTPQELRTVRGGKYALAAQAGSNRLSLSGFYGSFDELGNPVYDRTYWQTYTEAINTTPVEPSRPVVAVAVKSVLGNNVNVSINLTITYHMQFFDLEIPPLPAQSSRIGAMELDFVGQAPLARHPGRQPGRSALRADAEEFTPLDVSSRSNQTKGTGELGSRADHPSGAGSQRKREYPGKM